MNGLTCGDPALELDVGDAGDQADADAEARRDLPGEVGVEVDGAQRGEHREIAAGEVGLVLPLGGEAERRVGAETEGRTGADRLDVVGVRAGSRRASRACRWRWARGRGRRRGTRPRPR